MRYAMFLPNFGPFGDPTVLAELAAETEGAGWDGFFIWDHILFDDGDPQAVVDPCVALTACAVATKRIRLGALMTPLARRRPWKLARETASLDVLSGGRLIFGAGLGFPPHAEFGLFGEETDDVVRAQKLDEGLAILDGLWSGEEFEFSGRHHSVQRTRFLPPPVQRPRPPVWIAGWWPNKVPFRRAARWDGVFPELVGGATPTPEDLRALLAYVHEHREATTPFDAVLNGYTETGGEEGATTVEPYIEEGLTWWLERIEPNRLFSVAGARERIRSGPPKSP
jgi:alkanesulfonate monooxygenase SsuD/methylene tetrahydromethanopterin reductase-like flavin-dependent oxidoreductase (luciferase family)